MKTFPRSPAAARAAYAVLATCTVLAAAVAGCASAAAPAPRSSPAAATGLASPSSSATGTPEQQAEADAALLVEAFVPPPGAQAVPRSPVPSSPLSTRPQGGLPANDDVVIRTGWWLAPGGPQKLLSWEVAHLGSRYRNNGSGMNGPGVYNELFDVPAVPGLFDYQRLTVSAATAGHGQTAIRVDAMVDWIPARAPGDTVPTTARAAVLTETKDTGRGKPPAVATATLTDARQVAALAAYLNRLPVNPPGGAVDCPAAIGGGSIAVTFRPRPDGPVLAGAITTFAGCAFLSFTVPGRPSAEIGGPAAGNDLLAEVNQVAGLHWKLP